MEQYVGPRRRRWTGLRSQTLNHPGTMPRSSKSHWDFGELFPIEPSRHVLTVSELTTRVKRLLEKELGPIWVTGEVTNLRLQSSGHSYFTLKDANAQLNCVLFRGRSEEHTSELQSRPHLVCRLLLEKK